MPFPVELVQQVGGVLGTASTAIAAHLFRRFRKISKEAKNALELATETAASFRALSNGFESQVLEVVRPELRRRASSEARASRPDLSETQRRFDELQSMVEELKDALEQERLDREKLETEIRDYVREDISSWRELLRTIGQLEGQIRTK